MSEMSTPRDPGPPTNRLLAALPAEEMEVLRPDLEEISLPFKQTLFETNKPIKCVYFLHRGVASIVQEMEDGTAIEVAVIGPEGVVGLAAIFGGGFISAKAFIQVPSEASRIEAGAFRRAFDRCPRLRELVWRYTVALVSQLARNSACNRVHEVEKRLARWLLLTHDRAHADTFPLKQEFMAQMLGVSRPSVSIAAGVLQKAGLVSYVRGRITITDRSGLEAAACECYRVIRDQFDRLVGGDG
jgi:CRP-like cAMP-binding protein